MGRRPPPDDSERSPLDEALHGVRPLRDRDKVVAPPAPKPAPVRPPRRAGVRPAELRIRHRGERLEGLASGIDPAHLKRLRRGQVRAERELDLHGMTAAEAEAALAATLAESLEAGERCVLVVHGRGLHSRAGAVLRSQLADWLAASPHGARVMAFASTHDGGSTYVLLRRRRD